MILPLMPDGGEILKNLHSNIYDYEIITCLLNGRKHIAVGNGRGTYKTSYIIERCQPGDVVFVLNQYIAQDMMHRIKMLGRRPPFIVHINRKIDASTFGNYMNSFRGKKIAPKFVWFDSITEDEISRIMKDIIPRLFKENNPTAFIYFHH